MNRVKLELCLLWIGWIFVSIKIWKQISIVLTYGSFLFLPVHIKIKFQNFTTSLLIDSNEILISKSIGFPYFSKIKHSSSFSIFYHFWAIFKNQHFPKSEILFWKRLILYQNLMDQNIILKNLIKIISKFCHIM